VGIRTFAASSGAGRSPSSRLRTARAATLGFALLFGLSLAACNSLDGGPDRAVDANAELERLKRYFSVEMLSDYDALSSANEAGEKRAIRNEIVNGRVAFFDISYNLFKQALHREGVLTSIGTDVTTIGLGAAGALTSGGTSQILSAISAGVVGSKESIDKNAYFDKTMPALLIEMDAARKSVLALIKTGLATGIDIYPLEAALIDLENYYAAGTIPGAIAGIVEASGEKSAEANAILIATREKSFFEEPRQKRIDVLLGLIAALSDPAAIALQTNPPSTTPEIERVVALRDPTGLRFTDGAAARSLLNTRVTLIDRDDASLDAWEAALASE